MRAGLALGLSPVEVRDTLTIPQIFAVVEEWGRVNATRDLAQLEVINKAVAPFASEKNQSAFEALASRLRAIIQPISPRAAARSLFSALRARAERNAGQ